MSRQNSQEEENKLTSDQREELKKAFHLFDKGNKGKMAVRDLGALLRCLGWNPSERDIEEARNEFDSYARGTVSFNDVEKYVARRGGIYLGSKDEDDVIVAFQVLDKNGNGKIDIDEFKKFMTTMGEKMDADEVEELLECAKKNGDDFIHYDDLIKALREDST